MLVSVTSDELRVILRRLETERVTRLAIAGPHVVFNVPREDWLEAIGCENLYQLNELWPELTNHVIRLQNLSHLFLCHLDLSDADAHLIARNLGNITWLTVTNNNFSGIGAREIALHLPHLTKLNIWSNKIGDMGAQVIAGHLGSLTSLSVGSNGIGEAGALAIAKQLSNLTELSIWSNKIGNVGAREIADRLPLLTLLNFGDTNIDDVTTIAIADRLTRLTSLSVWDNDIGVRGAQAISECLGQLKSLNVSRNRLGNDGVISIATNLRHLHGFMLEGTDISQAAIESIGQHLPCLSVLSVASNPDVRDLTPLTRLRALQQLNVSATSVSDLEPFVERIVDGWPVHWSNWDFADGLCVSECPLIRPTVEIAEQGPDAVRNYFRELAVQGEDYLYEAKVLILGEGGAGKTSLLRRLYQPGIELPAEDETTRGIDIHRQDFIGHNGQAFRLNVWDFGGQQIYHATHQFFLTKNSLYVLVDDTRKDDKNINDEGFKFWLEVVETLSEGSPLLIFQNEKGDRSKTIDQAGIQGRFNNVKDFYRGNLDRTDSVNSLKVAIEYFVQKLPHIGERVPKKWVVIREELEQLAIDKPFITQDEYFAVYSRHLPFERMKALFLSRFLHDLGVFLHFQNDKVLSKTVILQNHWATEAVFSILDDEVIKSNRGRFTTADCQRLWASSTYADMRFELLGLMEKFELCYCLATPHADQWLAPQLLSPSKPPDITTWAQPDDLVLRFQYPFLPRGLVSRLMVRQHRFVKQLENCWAHGAVFKHHGTEALVEETTKGNEIELRARGPEHKVLLSVLSSELEALNDSFKGLKGRVEKMVPCTCHICRRTTNPEMFEHSLLVGRLKGGKKKTIECRRSEEDVSLLVLLDGLKLDRLPSWALKSTLVSDDSSSPNGLKSTSPKRLIAKGHRNKAGLSTIKIFLASSSELLDDRNEFDLYMRQQNDRLKNRGIYLQIIRWEHFLDAVSKTRLQDEYNRKLRECDFVVSLFKTKVGKFTEEEFDVAWAAFQETNKPRIYTFFRNFHLSGDEIMAKKKDLDSLDAFQQKLSSLGHFYTKYNDAEHLKRQFIDQLRILEIGV